MNRHPKSTGGRLPPRIRNECSVYIYVEYCLYFIGAGEPLKSPLQKLFPEVRRPTGRLCQSKEPLLVTTRLKLRRTSVEHSANVCQKFVVSSSSLGSLFSNFHIIYVEVVTAGGLSDHCA